MSTHTKTPKALAEEWFERVWNQGQESAVHEMMAPDCAILGLNTPSAGPEGFLVFHRSFHRNHWGRILYSE